MSWKWHGKKSYEFCPPGMQLPAGVFFLLETLPPLPEPSTVSCSWQIFIERLIFFRQPWLGLAGRCKQWTVTKNKKGQKGRMKRLCHAQWLAACKNHRSLFSAQWTLQGRNSLTKPCIKRGYTDQAVEVRARQRGVIPATTRSRPVLIGNNENDPLPITDTAKQPPRALISARIRSVKCCLVFRNHALNQKPYLNAGGFCSLPLSLTTFVLISDSYTLCHQLCRDGLAQRQLRKETQPFVFPSQRVSLCPHLQGLAADECFRSHCCSINCQGWLYNTLKGAPSCKDSFKNALSFNSHSIFPQRHSIHISQMKHLSSTGCVAKEFNKYRAGPGIQVWPTTKSNFLTNLQCGPSLLGILKANSKM